MAGRIVRDLAGHLEATPAIEAQLEAVRGEGDLRAAAAKGLVFDCLEQGRAGSSAPLVLTRLEPLDRSD